MEEKFFSDNTIFHSEDMNTFQNIVGQVSLSTEVSIDSAKQDIHKYIEHYTKMAEVYSKVADSLPDIKEKLNNLDLDTRLKKLESNLTNIGGD